MYIMNDHDFHVPTSTSTWPTEFQMYWQNSEKSIIGAAPGPSGYASVVVPSTPTMYEVLHKLQDSISDHIRQFVH